MSIKFHVEQRGRGLIKSVRRVARRFDGRILKSDPRRHLALSPGTLLKFYHHWRRNAEVPGAFTLNYVSGRRYIDGALLVRFVNFAADREWPSFRAAWLAFCKRGGSFGPGSRNGRKLTLRYHALIWNLPKGCFTALKREWKALHQAQRNIAALRMRFVSEIRGRVPNKLPRNIKVATGDFSI